MIANTQTNTKFKDLRLKVNEVIVAVNELQSNGIATNTNQYLQVANAEAKYATKAYAASNSYVNILLANTNAYIAQIAAVVSSPSSEAIDYGFITSSVDLDTSRDYGTL